MLDLNLPREDGREVLADTESDEALCDIPVVVSATSVLVEGILRGYKLHANASIIKPVGFNRFVEVVSPDRSVFVTVVSLLY